MSVPKHSVSAAKVAQIFDDAPVGCVRGGVALDNETKLFFCPSDWERLIMPLEQLGLSSRGIAAGGVDTRPMVLLACAPNDYIHGVHMWMAVHRCGFIQLPLLKCQGWETGKGGGTSRAFSLGKICFCHE